MRAVTNCPACQTQFFVTEDQLNKHGGKVRCGQCLHVFDATAQFVDVNTPPPTLPSKQEQPTIDDDFDITQEVVELSATSDEIKAFTAELSNAETGNDYVSPQHEIDNRILIDEDDFEVSSHQIDQEASQLNDITKLTFTADNQANYFVDLAKKPIKKNHRWLWSLGAVILFFVAIAQSIYFLRDGIATHYPNIKPYLVSACQQFSCNLNLPKQIEFIVIDDSDMQEDLNHAGLMHLSSSLINTAGFNQAYPNLELTLTDIEDKPILRRSFKPSEYLPTDVNIVASFKAGEEVKIKLAITTQDVAVAGYRLFVTY